MSATSFTGTVARITSRAFTSKKTGKPGTAFNVVLVNDQGQEFSPVGGFFEPPGCNEGDKVALSATESNGYFNVVKGSLKVLAAADNVVKQAVPRQAQPPAAAQAKVAQPVAEQTGRKTNPEDAKRITYQASVGRAIEAVGVLLQHKALPISAATSKASEADRFETIVAAIDKLSVKFYHDAMTLRLLETVADSGADTTTTAPLPGAEGDGDEIPY